LRRFDLRVPRWQAAIFRGVELIAAPAVTPGTPIGRAVYICFTEHHFGRGRSLND
jgi:hypothetical protein